MKIESLRIARYKVFRDAEMRDIPGLCVVVGANGSGKSTLFAVFGFLKEAMATNATTALAKYGGGRGFQEVRSRGTEGDIEFEIKFRVKFRDQPRTRLVTYILAIGEEDGRAVVTRELLRYRRGQRGKPWHYLDFARGRGYAVTNEFEDVADESQLHREEQDLKSPDILAIKGLAQFQQFPAVVALGNLIENWHVSDFHISSARREPEAGYAEHLDTSGENLALVAQFLYKHHRQTFDTICQKLAERVPGIDRVDAKTTEEGRVLLRFRDSGFEDPFLARHVSDGTIKMFAYLVLLYDPRPHPLLCVEEPENQLYVGLLWDLAEELRDYARRGGQVFVSTHSPDFLNACGLDEVFWLEKTGGGSVIKRAQDNEQLRAYMEAGDQMGYLWKQGFFEGIGP